MRECTQEAVEELEFKVSVALAEAEKWTDYTYQAIQYIQRKSNNEVSLQNINRTFPYLKNADCSLIMEEEDEDDGVCC